MQRGRGFRAAWAVTRLVGARARRRRSAAALVALSVAGSSMLARLDRAKVTMLVATHDRDLIAAASDRLDLRDARRG